MPKALLPEIINRLISQVLLGLIALYQRLLSPLFGTQCRFQPTCSRYAQQAIRERGPWCGSALAIWRICRCNPFCEGGHDPVPTTAFPDTTLQPIPKSNHHDGSQT